MPKRRATSSFARSKRNKHPLLPLAVFSRSKSSAADPATPEITPKPVAEPLDEAVNINLRRRRQHIADGRVGGSASTEGTHCLPPHTKLSPDLNLLRPSHGALAGPVSK